MKRKYFGVMLSVCFVFGVMFPVYAGDLDLEKITEGLKEALKVGFTNAVKKVGIEDGFYKNIDIKIPMPDTLENAEDFLKSIGADEYSEKLVKKMNRAAETASPKAKDIFINAVKKMKFDDAKIIWEGKGHEATDFLQKATSESLSKEFYPLIKETMEEVNTIKTYNGFIDKYSSNPLIEKVNLDLAEYVTEKSIEGLFKMVAVEEEKIRKDPEARINDLLKDVFGDLFK